MKNFTVSKALKGFFVLGVILFFYSCSLNEGEKIDRELTFNQKKAELRTNARLMATALRNTFDENKHSELNNVILYSGMKKNFFAKKNDDEFYNSFSKIEVEYDFQNGVYSNNVKKLNAKLSGKALSYFKRLSSLFTPGGSILDFDVYDNLRVSGDSTEYTLEEFNEDVQVAVVDIGKEVDGDTSLNDDEKLNLLSYIYTIEESLPVMFDELTKMFVVPNSGRGLWKWLKKAVKNVVNAVATVINAVVINALYIPTIGIGTILGSPIAGLIGGAAIGFVSGWDAVINQNQGLYICVFCVSSPSTNACFGPPC